MTDYRKRIRQDENAFQRLLEVIPGFDGYREREIRRTADKLVRENLVAELDRVRDALNRIVAAWSRAGKLGRLTEIDRLARMLGKARDNIRFADYGYTGFFDAVKIKEEQLDRMYEYDVSLHENVAACGAAVAELAQADDEQAPEKMGALETALRELQDRVDRREEVAASAADDDR